MIIDRSHIIEGLFHFSQQGNGVIIGKPGIGKSYSIAELAEKLSGENIPVLILPIDTLPDGTNQSVEAEIESNGDWISYLDQVKLSGDHRAVLIFDAFDAARDVELRKQILAQIGKAIFRLKKWNVIVSVRTYDATKSPQLLKLFGNQNYDQHITCRHYEIPELSDNELATAFKSNPVLARFYGAADEELKRILQIPFFLRLLEIVLEDVDEAELEKMKLIKSETELLDKYWDKKVANTEYSYKKESCLKGIANNLVQNKSMSALKDVFVQDEITFKELRSDDLISEVGVGEKYVAFSHNILFDYIVGRVIIPAEPEELLDFIAQDNSRPFFLRPSFIFHFTRLWYHYRRSFWKNYSCLNRQTDNNILLFKRLIPTSVIANEFENITDLEPIIEEKTVVQQLLQSIRFLSGRNIGSRDIELLYYLTDNLNVAFLWDFAFVLDKILQQGGIIESKHIEKSGAISRRFLRYILDERKIRPERRQSMDRLGSTRGIEFVSKTFNSNTKDSILLLRQVLDLLKEPDFEIWYFSSLSRDLKHFIKDAPEFASEVYYRIFNHREISDEKTNMGTVTLNLVSNRRQDFEMCYYRLLQLFPTFLAAAPEIAIETGLGIVNNYVEKDKLHILNNENKILHEIHVDNISSKYLPDASSMWHDTLAYHKPAQLAEKIIDYLKKLIDENSQDKLFSAIEVYIMNAVVGFTWKKLIEFGNEHPEILKEYLYQLALNRIILECSDTTYEIGISLQKIFPLLDTPQRLHMEEFILKLLETNDKEKKKSADRIVNKLLNCIPQNLLQGKEALSFIKRSAIIKNEPTFKATWSSMPYTTDKWLEDQGVDLRSEANKEIYNLLNALEVFNQNKINDTPNRDEFSQLLQTADNLFGQVHQGKYDKELEFSALKEVAKFYSIITRDPTQISKTDYNNSKKAILYSLEYVSKYDETFDESSSPSFGYSPTPRIEASSALVGLFSFCQDDIILENIHKSVHDSNPVVRFNVLRNIALLWSYEQDDYWQIVLERLANESDSFTIATVLNNIYRKDIIDIEEKITQVIKIGATRICEFGKRDSFTKAYTGLLLYLIDNKKNKIARNIIDNHIGSTDFIQELVFRLFDFIDPRYLNNDYTVESTRRELIRLFQHIASENLEMLKEDDPAKFTEEESPERDRLLLVDFIVQRIYFGLDINEAIRKNHELQPSEKNKRAFYDRVKPILMNVVGSSKEIGEGIMIAHTAHYLVETLNGVIKFYPEEAKSILNMVSQVTELSHRTGYTFDTSAIEEIVNLTEILFADHKELLRDDESLSQLVSILNIYVECGWTQALELLWRLDEAFK